jgi:LmbE family N-acetylglucosaminyl deacetylase
MGESFESRFVPYHASRSAGQGAALVFAPHPDDEVFGCFGAIWRHVQNHDPVRVIIATDGRFGDPDLAGKMIRNTMPPETVSAYIRKRRDESIKAAELTGCKPPLFWDIPDRHLVHDDRLVSKIGEQIDQFRPRVVYAPSIYEMHPDHRNLATGVLDALGRLADGPDLFMYEVGRPMPSPDCLLDITDVAAHKQAAARCFKSQLAVCPYDAYMTSLNHFRSFTLAPAVTQAEAYMVVRPPAYRERIEQLRRMEKQDRDRRDIPAAGNGFLSTIKSLFFSGRP